MLWNVSQATTCIKRSCDFFLFTTIEGYDLLTPENGKYAVHIMPIENSMTIISMKDFCLISILDIHEILRGF